MGLGDRIKDWVDAVKEDWKTPLMGWVANSLTSGVESAFDFFEADIREEVKPSLQMLRDLEGMPADLKNILDKAIGEPKAIQFVALMPYLVGIMIGLGMGMAQPATRVGSYQIDKFLHSARLDPFTAIRAYFRNFIPLSKLEKDLADLGWSDADIKHLIEVSYYFPPPSDLINWVAKEVFEPEMIKRYGLDDEFDKIDLSLFAKAGIQPEMVKNYWMAHWQHPQFQTVTTMLHRGLLTPAEVYNWYRLVEIPPFWRDKLTKISWDLPNRIELRMMARYGLVDKEFLVTMLEKVGLDEDYRDVASDMMLVMGIRTDFSTRYRNGWLTREQLASELAESGLSEKVQERLYAWIVKNDSPERVAKERDLTKTEIYKGVKKGILGWGEGQALLERMGYQDWEASYILELNVGALEGSPETYSEFKRLVEGYRLSQGLDSKMPSQELVLAEKALKEAEKTLKEVKEGLREDLTEAQAKKAVDDNAYHYRQLLTKEQGKD